jgi:hypothetical protein
VLHASLSRPSPPSRFPHFSPTRRRARHRPHRGRGLVGVAVIVSAGVVLGACSSSNNTGATATTATTSAAGTTTTSGGSSAGGGSSAASQLNALSSSVQAGQRATFKAVYTSRSSTGTSQTITIEQMPPKSVFSVATGKIIDDGTTSYFCGAQGGQEQCVEESSTGPNPFASITQIFNPTTLLNEFHAAETAAAAHSAGFSLAFSDSSYAGLTAKCVNYTNSTQTVKYCVTDSGILAYAQAPGGTFELTSFSSSPAPSDFSPPAGVPLITLPPGASVTSLP